jgi:putative ABC transport system substrate-binding protein
MQRREALTILAGVAVAWPLAAHPQQKAIYRIAYLALLPGENSSLAQTLRERLHQLGYIEGKNMIFDYRSADNRPERLSQLAIELVQTSPDVIVAGYGTLTAKAAKAATTTTPIVFTNVADPVGAGLVQSLNRPGTNLTGLTGQVPDIVGKRLQILNELTPGNGVVAVLMNPDTPASAAVLNELRPAANLLSKRIEVFQARTADEIKDGIQAAAKTGAAALLTIDDPLILGSKQEIADLSIKARLPTMFSFKAFVEVGGLISFGADRPQLNRRAAELVDKILQGTKPMDIPVEQPTKFELAINLKTARALGLTVPHALLQRADEVIE